MKNFFWLCAFGLIFFPIASRPLYADDAREYPPPILYRIGYTEGIGGSGVGDKGALSGGLEFEFYRTARMAVSLSIDEIIDRTARHVNRPIVPMLANFRFFLGGGAPLSGFYVSGGVGEAIPFWDWHGGGTVAWQGSLGYASLGGGFFELRYVGRPSETVIRGGVPFVLNNTFIGASTGARF